MKNKFLLMAFLCLFAFSANAQYNSFTINNNAPCDLYVVLYGTTSSAIPACQANYRSNVIAIAAGGVVTYTDPAAVPGGLDDGTGVVLGASDNFTFARVYHGNPMAACTAPGTANMSDCLAAGVTSVTGFSLDNFSGGGCVACSSGVTINWVVLTATHAGIDIF